MLFIVITIKEPKEEQHHLQELKEEPSDIEEGGLDLTVPFKPISDYLSNRQEMLEQCFHVLGQNKLKKMLPDELKVFNSIHSSSFHTSSSVYLEGFHFVFAAVLFL